MNVHNVFFISVFILSCNIPEIYGRKNYYKPYGMRNESSLNIEAISFRSQLADGPFWDEKTGQLYYIDILAQTVNRYDPIKETTAVVTLDDVVSFVIPIKGERNKFVIGLGPSVAVMTWDGISPKPENVKILTTVANPNDGSRVNDGKADAFGRLWSGTLGPRIGSLVETVPFDGVLFRLNKDLTANIQARDVTLSNGIAWSLDNKKMYFADTGVAVIFVFNYDLLKGTISHGKVLFDFKKNGIKGFPDGLTVDIEGKLWAACIQGAQILRIDPKKRKVIQSISLPSYQPTSFAFGGPNYEDLYVTSGNAEIPLELEEKYPLSGYIFRVTGLGVRGLPPRRVIL